MILDVVALPTPFEELPLRLSAHAPLSRVGLLRALHQDGPLTRSQMATIFQVNRSTIKNAVEDITRLGFVDEQQYPVTEGERRPGRPSLLVHPRAESLAVVVMEFSESIFRLAVFGLGATLLLEETWQASLLSEDEQCQNIRNLLQERIPHVCVVALTAAVESTPRDLDAGAECSVIRLQASSLIARLSSVLPEKPHVAGVVDYHICSAFGEACRGSRRQEALYLSFDSGIWGTQIFHFGERRRTLDLNLFHAPIRGAQHRCECGLTGCWGTFGSGRPQQPPPTLEQYVADSSGYEGGDLRRLVDAARRRAINDIARYIAEGLHSILSILRVDQIILVGKILGNLPQEALLLVEEFLKEARLTAPVHVASANFGPEGVRIGAAELAFQQAFDKLTL